MSNTEYRVPNIERKKKREQRTETASEGRQDFLEPGTRTFLISDFLLFIIIIIIIIIGYGYFC